MNGLPSSKSHRTEFCVSESVFHGTLVTDVRRYTGFYDEMCLGNAESCEVKQSSTVFICDSLRERYTMHTFQNHLTTEPILIAFSSKRLLGLVL